VLRTATNKNQGNIMGVIAIAGTVIAEIPDVIKLIDTLSQAGLLTAEQEARARAANAYSEQQAVKDLGGVA